MYVVLAEHQQSEIKKSFFTFVICVENNINLTDFENLKNTIKCLKFGLVQCMYFVQ